MGLPRASAGPAQSFRTDAVLMAEEQQSVSILTAVQLFLGSVFYFASSQEDWAVIYVAVALLVYSELLQLLCNNFYLFMVAATASFCCCANCFDCYFPASSEMHQLCSSM
ncbi:hypothetical protein RHGRI_037139 [Rhododendron griersonianum]|uniref:Uncharacterized protein n=1 Tax=Rhododendron griersonianum TaxID=479676 RepID=A0AAV6HUY3_9ERIC|nr:hypothetical protein RHGRI_037139 [Rhododendron griersonianum]